MQEIYISTDVETNGPIPGDFSMLSLASAAFCEDGKLASCFSLNLEQLPDASEHPETMEFWQRHPDAWRQCRAEPVEPRKAMERYVEWLDVQRGKPVFVAYPAGFDFLFVYWYLMHFVGRSPFSFSALDIKTYASALLKLPYRDATKRKWPRRWFYSSGPHSHVALEDAKEQGRSFMAMRREVLGVMTGGFRVAGGKR